MTIYNATAIPEEELRQEFTIPESKKVIPPYPGIGEIFMYKDNELSNRSLVQRIEEIVKDALKHNADSAIISGDDLVCGLFEREFEMHGIATSFINYWSSQKEVENARPL
ncbi:MAG: hypothetical protein PHG23_02555 [Candidatus Pacebacteria bacterium]|nr:hypothetical protein [Candidatus Paceibacterota bacterium]